jgi:hypothetical protein
LSPDVVVILLDGKPYTREELAKPVHLPAGEHTLEARRADDSVVESHTFTVGEEDKVVDPFNGTEAVDHKGPSKSKPAGPDASETNRPAHLRLPGAAAWDLKQLEVYFTLLKATYEPENNRVVWLAEAKRGFDYVPFVVYPRACFYDAESVRLSESSFVFDPSGKLEKGDRLRIMLALPNKAVFKATRRVLLLMPDLKEFPATAKADVKRGSRLPGPAAWDLKQLEVYFTLLKATHEPANSRVVWLAEAKRGFDYVPFVVYPRACFYDAVGVRLSESSFDFSPSSKVLKGERIRITLGLPNEATFKATMRVLSLPTDLKEFPAGAKAEVKRGGSLPGPANWGLKPLEEYFTLLKATYEPENNRVVWLAEAKRGFNYIPFVVYLKARFYDAGNVRVHDTSFDFSPSGKVLKGERIRIILGLPSEATLKRTKKVALEK